MNVTKILYSKERLYSPSKIMEGDSREMSREHLHDYSRNSKDYWSTEIHPTTTAFPVSRTSSGQQDGARGDRMWQCCGQAEIVWAMDIEGRWVNR